MSSSRTKPHRLQPQLHHRAPVIRPLNGGKASEVAKPAEHSWPSASLWFHHNLHRETADYQRIAPEEFGAIYQEFGQHELQVPHWQPKVQHWLPLTPPAVETLPQISLFKTCLQRRTVRQFARKHIALHQLSSLLYINLSQFQDLYSAPEPHRAHLHEQFQRRPYPTASGWATTHAYVVVKRVAGLAPGIYFYNGETHSLGRLPSRTTCSLTELLADQHYCEDLAFGVFLTVDLRRNWLKCNDNLGYVLAYTEVGHASQNILLTATALKLDTWLSGTMNLRAVRQQLAINQPFIHPCLFVGFGIAKHQTALPEVCL
jgi:SagB-type dehydrogenase family enzyme